MRARRITRRTTATMATMSAGGTVGTSQRAPEKPASHLEKKIRTICLLISPHTVEKPLCLYIMHPMVEMTIWCLTFLEDHMMYNDSDICSPMGNLGP